MKLTGWIISSCINKWSVDWKLNPLFQNDNNWLLCFFSDGSHISSIVIVRNLGVFDKQMAVRKRSSLMDIFAEKPTMEKLAKNRKTEEAINPKGILKNMIKNAGYISTSAPHWQIFIVSLHCCENWTPAGKITIVFICDGKLTEVLGLTCIMSLDSIKWLKTGRLGRTVLDMCYISAAV